MVDGKETPSEGSLVTDTAPLTDIIIARFWQFCNYLREIRQNEHEKNQMRKKQEQTVMTERESQIMDLLEKEKFITVRRLSQVTFTSESSIRRDKHHYMDQLTMLYHYIN